MSSAAEEYFISKARGRGRRRRRGGEAEFLRSALGGCSAPRKKLIGDAIGVRLQDQLKMFFCFRQGYVGSFDTNNAKNSAMLDSILSAFLLIRTEHYLGFLF